MKKRSITKNLKRFGNTCVAAGLLCATSVQAGTATFDFQEDPLASGLLKIYNNATWWWPGTDPTDANNGYLSITDALAGQRGVIVFEDIDNGQVIKAFTMEMKIRAGNGHADPADGFSINYARSNDPLLTALEQTDPPTPGAFAQGQNCEANLPEEGTQTGIGIGFDTWNSGGTAGSLCAVVDQSIGLDVRALTVRVDGILVAQFPLPTINGTCTDATSIQTGPLDANNPGSPAPLCWAPLKVELKEDGKLNVWWKNVQLLTDYQTAFFPSPGRLVFGGRTGDNYQLTHVDDIVLTTVPAATAIVGAATGTPTGFSVVINDSGASVVDVTKPIDLKLDGATVTPTSVSKTGGATTVTYVGTTPFAPASVHQVDITVRDTNNNVINGTPSFTVPNYLALPASWAVAAATTPGFVVKPYKTEAGNPNTMSWTDEQLLGLYGANLGTMNSATHAGVLDFSNTTSPGSNGQFPNDLRWTLFGLPELDPDTANISIAAMGYIHLPQAGVYTFGGNSDDGIRLTFSPSAQSILGAEVPGMTFNGGRGIAANQNSGMVYVAQPGYYPFRLLWENGGGGADLEFYTRSTPAGAQIVLVNDADPNALKVYQAAATAPAYVSYASPVLMKTGFSPVGELEFRITDAGTTVQPADVAVKVNGAAQTVNATKTGNVTTAKVAAPGVWPAGTHTIELSYGTSVYTYTFTVPVYVTLDVAQSVPLGSEDATKPGFVANIAQADRTGTTGTINRIYWAEQLLAGYWQTNIATVKSTTIPGVINYNIGTDDQGAFHDGNGFPEELFPGIPGWNSNPDPAAQAIAANEHFAFEFKTWLEFKTAGIYELNFNSDDGFILSVGHERPMHNGQLEVTAPAAIAGGIATLWGNDAGISVFSNTVPITGKIVLMRDNAAAIPSEGCGTIANAAALAGNIALVERGTCEFSQKAKNAYDAGATAIVIGTTRPEVAPAEGWFPAEPGAGAAGRQPIPVVMIDRDAYKRLTNALGAGEVTGTLHPWVRGGQTVVEYNDAKGASDVRQLVRIAQPGLYPIRIAFWQGGGGGNAEFQQHFADGTRALINDLANANALRAFQEVKVAPRPTLSFQKTGDTMTLTYTGTLQSSETANGTYTDVQGASSPYPVNTATGNKFFRARN